WQTDVRRLLGWSTVSQVGYLLLPVAVAGNADLALPSLLLYLAGYTASNITAFAVAAALPARRSIEDFRGAAAAHPWLTVALVVSLLGLVGTPPTAVFVGKLTTFTAAWDGGLAWLVVVAAINTVASLFYYLRWLAPMFARGKADVRAPVPANPSASRAAVIGAIAVLSIGIAAGPVLSAFGMPHAG
ncbi:MAG: NADH-quinone oxidoreductase subunit N, partial [Cryobacterium sp.]|nr:NADH-quinone oxidoreductase subunit N [Cryobacterium sp.]